jgi:septum formation protein
MEIILGSQSPRRRELMAGLGISFTAVSIDADETYPSDLREGDIPLYISRAKAHAYASALQPGQILITADTIVWSEGRMLGKPHDAEDAQAMLRLLSGRTHQVYTAVTFAQADGKMESVVDRTDVTFRVLTDEEIAHYITTYKPLDKAGAYGIQEWIGYIGCTRLEGSYFNVMGFPIHLVYDQLKKRGVF